MVSITGIALTKGDDPYVMTSEASLLTFFETNGGYNAPWSTDTNDDGLNEPWLSISLDWADPANVNLNMYVVGSNNQSYESSTSNSRFEGDYFNGNLFPGGVYRVYLTANGNSGPVDYLFTATDYNGKVSIIESSITNNGFIGKITKTGGATNDITYVIEAL